MKTVHLPKRFITRYPELKETVTSLRYVRDDFNVPVGVVLVDWQGRAGYSLVNTKMGDKFDAVTGIRKALYRTAAGRTLEDLKKKFHPEGQGACSLEYRENAAAAYRAVCEVERYREG